MTDLVEQLREHMTTDHLRGCEGRNYSCDCGYDLKTEGLLELSATELAALRDRVKELEAERDAAFGLSKCECAAEEACANIVLAEARAETAERELEAANANHRTMASRLARIEAETIERCARVAESIGSPVGAGDGCGTRIVGTSMEAAAAIRQLSATDGKGK